MTENRPEDLISLNLPDSPETPKTAGNARQFATVSFSLKTNGVKTDLKLKVENGVVLSPTLVTTYKGKWYPSTDLCDGVPLADAYATAREFHESNLKKFTQAPQKKRNNSSRGFLWGLFK